MLKIAITGSDGLVGSRIQELLYQDFEFIPLLHSQIDITDKPSVDKFIERHDFDLCLHLAAYTNVDAAEIDKEIVYKTNVTGTQNLFDAINEKGKRFIYISTDFVFDGNNPPYYEESKPNPIGYYGQTKYEGEKMVQNKAMIIRIAYPYRSSFESKKDFVRNIKSLLEEGRELKMVTDSSITPTFIDDIAFGLKHLILNYNPQIYHLVGPDSLSPLNVAKLIAKKFKLNENLIKPTKYQDYFEGRAKRPRYSEIRSRENNFYKMKTFKEGLDLIV